MASKGTCKCGTRIIDNYHISLKWKTILLLIQPKMAMVMGRSINDIVKTKHCGNNCID